MLNFLRNVRALSIDISAGGVVFAAALAKWVGLNHEPIVYGVLFLSIWLIYTFDHLTDAKFQKVPNTYRHQMHFHHRQFLSRMVMLVSLCNAILVCFLPLQTLLSGTIVLVYMAIYFLLVRYFDFWYKEFAIAIGYASGITIVVFSHSDFTGDIQQKLALWLVVFLFALINVLIIAVVDYNLDKSTGNAALSAKLSIKQLEFFAFFLLIPTAGVILYLWLNEELDFILSLVLFLMLIVDVVLLSVKSKTSQNEIFRFFADSVFFLPIIYLFY